MTTLNKTSKNINASKNIYDNTAIECIELEEIKDTLDNTLTAFKELIDKVEEDLYSNMLDFSDIFKEAKNLKDDFYSVLYEALDNNTFLARIVLTDEITEFGRQFFEDNFKALEQLEEIEREKGNFYNEDEFDEFLLSLMNDFLNESFTEKPFWLNIDEEQSLKDFKSATSFYVHTIEIKGVEYDIYTL